MCSDPFAEILPNNTPDFNMVFDGWRKGSKVAIPGPPVRALSPSAEALSRIAANVGYVIEPEYIDKQDFNVPDMVSHLVTAYRSLKLRFQDLERERDALEQERVRLEGVIQVNRVIAQNQQAEWRNQENQYSTQINNLKDTRDLQAQLRKECEGRIGTMQIEHANRVTNLKARYKEEEQRMREEHEFAVQGLKGTIQSLQTHAEEREKDFIFGKTQLEEAHRIKQDELKEQFEAHKSKLKQVHSQQQERLQKGIQSRNKALIARENFSPITDGELKSMFSDLVHEVDALARLKWTLNRSPWTDELQSQISDTPKRLQKQILQDTIWNALFENVFCSPFRVFEKEGSVLESQWNKAFGKGRVALATPDHSNLNGS